MVGANWSTPLHPLMSSDSHYYGRMIEAPGRPENSPGVMDVRTQAPSAEKKISAPGLEIWLRAKSVGDRSILIDVTNDNTDVKEEHTGISKWVVFSMQLLSVRD